MYKISQLTGTKLWIPAIIFIGVSCSSVKNYTAEYYYKNDQLYDSMKQTYKKLYQQSPFTIAFTNKSFSNLTIDIITDSINYNYQFDISEPRLADTLTKFHLNQTEVLLLIRQMQTMHCIWINNLDYYVNGFKESMVFISLKTSPPNLIFAKKNYFILAYFDKPQFFDAQERLLINGTSSQINQINGCVLKKINDSICYTRSAQYR